MVERRKDLEGKSFGEVEKVIRREEGVEGVVVAVVGSGQAIGKERVEQMSKPEEDEEQYYGDDAAAIQGCPRTLHLHYCCCLRSREWLR